MQVMVYQSTYRKGHRTETALLAVTANLLSNVDNKLASVVAFFDLSAVFDMLDHQIMLKKLSVHYRIQGKLFSGSFPTILAVSNLSP